MTHVAYDLNYAAVNPCQVSIYVAIMLRLKMEGAMSALDQAASLLFTERQRITNVKFYLGSRREVTADEIAAEFVRIESLIDAGQRSPVDDIDGNLDD